MAKKKSRDEAYNSIQELIFSMEIRPGQSITEHALSEQLGIGRTPVREALARLESEGLIYSNKGRKTVHTLTIEEIKEIFDVKMALESAIAARAAERGTPADKEKLTSIMKEMRELSKKRSENEEQRQTYLDEWIRIDYALHEVIFKMAGNSKAEKIIRNLNVQWHRTRISVYAIEGRVLRSAREHQEVVNFIVKGNPGKAEASMKKHLATLKVEIENAMKLFNYPMR